MLVINHFTAAYGGDSYGDSWNVQIKKLPVVRLVVSVLVLVVVATGRCCMIKVVLFPRLQSQKQNGSKDLYSSNYGT